MLDNADGARRRELERKAYAPGGGLSDAEAEELRALSRAAAPVVVAPAPVAEPVAPLDAPEPVLNLPIAEQADRSDEELANPEPANPGPANSELANSEPTNSAPAKRRRWLAPLAAVLTLILGFGAGWLAFGRDAAPAMTAAQRDTWVQLQASSAFDPGSVQLIGSQFGVDAWSATKNDGKLDCFTLTGTEGRSQSPTCQLSDRERSAYDLQASIGVTDGEDELMVWAVLAQDTFGKPVVIMQRQNANVVWDWRSQYSAEELPIAEFLDSKGFRGDVLQAIGYDGDVPIWLHEDTQACLLVATPTEISAQACGDVSATQSLDLAVPGATYSVQMTEMRGPQLTIIRTPASVVCDVDSGYCATADDKTGFPDE